MHRGRILLPKIRQCRQKCRQILTQKSGNPEAIQPGQVFRGSGFRLHCQPFRPATLRAPTPPNALAYFYTIRPFVLGISPFLLGSISTAERIALAAALNKPSIL